MFDTITSIERKELFQILCHEVAACRACPRLACGRQFLSRANGTLTPKVVFVGETPGRLAPGLPAGRPGPDQSRYRFDELLASIDLSRDEVFFTSSVLCCPTRHHEGVSPTGDEARRCLRFLRETLTLLRPPVVATLGGAALRSVGRLLGRPMVLAEVAGTILEFDDFVLVPLYSTDSQTLACTRGMSQQKADFAAVRAAIEYTTLAGV